MLRQVRRWRGSTPSERLSLDAALPDNDIKKLRRTIDDCIEGRGGEVAARRRATAIGAAFSDLDPVGRRRFFDLLANEYDHEDDEVDLAISKVVQATEPDQRRRAERELLQTLQPRRERLLRRFVGIDGGLPFLIDLREELLPHRKATGSLGAVDEDLRNILTSWFDVALLRLERIEWSSAASTLEKLIEYEAVHAIESWEDLKGRLGPDRRCYGYFHPSMPGEPIIFVEVALTKGIARDLPPLLDHDDADRLESTDADTAIFYSISNCHQGLAGVSLGDLLIKRVVEELSATLPNLTTFSTLSPIPGFRTWLQQQVDDDTAHEELLIEEERTSIAPDDPARAIERLASLATAASPPSAETLEPFRPALLRLAARYLTVERRGSRALDPVANFHLSNGSRVEQINWRANPGLAGWERGMGMMVNYRYVPDSIESNHDKYVMDGSIETASEVERLLR